MKAAIYWSGICLVCFALSLNLHLRGRRSPQTSHVLGIILLGLIVAAPFLVRWWYLIYAVSATWLAVALFTPIAGKLASKMLGYRVGIQTQFYEKSPSQEFQAGELNVEGLFEKVRRDDEADKDKLSRLSVRPDIAAVLKRESVSTGEFYDLRQQLKLCSLKDLTWAILSDPDDLERLIRYRREGLPHLEISSRFRRGEHLV